MKEAKMSLQRIVIMGLMCVCVLLVVAFNNQFHSLVQPPADKIVFSKNLRSEKTAAPAVVLEDAADVPPPLVHYEPEDIKTMSIGDADNHGLSTEKDLAVHSRDLEEKASNSSGSTLSAVNVDNATLVSTPIPIQSAVSPVSVDLAQSNDLNMVNASQVSIEEQEETVAPAERVTSATIVVPASDTLFSHLVELYESNLIQEEILQLEDINRVFEMDSSQLDVVMGFHGALRSGDFWPIKSSSSAISSGSSVMRSTQIEDSQLVTAIRGAIRSQNISFVVEYMHAKSVSTKSFAFQRSKSMIVDVPIVQMLSHMETGYSPSPIRSSIDMDEAKSPRRRVEASLQRSVFTSVDSLSPFLLLNPKEHTRSCLQAIESFSVFVRDMLPFEFEEELGSLLCQCAVSVVPSRLPELPFFANWESMSSLVSNAMTGRCRWSIADNIASFAALRYDMIVITVESVDSPERSSSSCRAREDNDRLSLLDLINSDVDWIAPSRLNVAKALSAFLGVQDKPLEANAFVSLKWNSSVLFDCQSTEQKFHQLPRRSRVSYTRPRARDAQSISTHNRSLTSAVDQANVPAASPLINANITVDHVINETEIINETARRRLMDENELLAMESTSFAWLLPQDVIERNSLSDQRSQSVLNGLKQIIVDMSTNHPERLTSSAAQQGPSMSVTSNMRRMHSQLMVDEQPYYIHWMNILESYRSTLDDSQSLLERMTSSDKPQLIYLIGERLSLLSLKLAKMINLQRSPATSGPATILLAINSNADAADSLFRLSRLLTLDNLIVGSPRWSFASIVAMLGSPERANMQLIDEDVILQVLSLAWERLRSSSQQEDELCSKSLELAEELIAVLLFMSKTTIMKFPVVSELESILRVVSAPCASTWSLSLTQSLSFLVNASQSLQMGSTVVIEELWLPTEESLNKRNESLTSVYRIDLLPLQFDSTMSYRSQDIHVKNIQSKYWSRSSAQGLSLYTMMWSGLLRDYKRRLAPLLVNLPLWKAKDNIEWTRALGTLSPWHVFLQVYSTHATAHKQKKMKLAAISKSFEWRIMLADALWSSSDAQVVNLGISSSSTSSLTQALQQELSVGKVLYDELRQEFDSHPAEMANGQFSFVEHDSAEGFVSTRLALDYPEATIISLERDSLRSDLHYKLVEKLNISNNAVCHKQLLEDAAVYRNIYECPELFRFQLLFNKVLQGFADSSSMINWGESMGLALSSALTSFVYVPNRALVSWVVHVLHGSILVRGRSTSLHPQANSESVFMLDRLPGSYRSLFEALGVTPVMLSHELLVERDSAADISDDQQGEEFSEVRLRRQQQQERNIILSQHYKSLSSLSSHPQTVFHSFHSDWLLGAARAREGDTALLVSPLAAHSSMNREGRAIDNSQTGNYRGGAIGREQGMPNIFVEFPLMRCDIVNMTRHVHHHFDYRRDGHTRTYTMRVQVNESATLFARDVLNQDDLSSAITLVDKDGVHLSAVTGDRRADLPLGVHPAQHHAVSVRLHRDKDNWPIPYVSIYGITLITALRLGLNDKQRDKFFHSFLQLPLYEDMAPWNIVLMGPVLDYIDYDTREFTFDNDVKKAYKVMTLLMNYKRTVEDFKKCGSKAGTIYGLPYVSDCVGNKELDLKCEDLAFPVPCADRQCHSDYVSCLRSLANIAEQIANQERRAQLSTIDNTHTPAIDHVSQNMASAMTALVAKFNESNYEKLSYEEFLHAQTSL